MGIFVVIPTPALYVLFCTVILGIFHVIELQLILAPHNLLDKKVIIHTQTDQLFMLLSPHTNEKMLLCGAFNENL